jgi:hypothetical protein
MAEGMAFDQMNPPKHVTDPLGLGLKEYPKHLHKAGTADDGVGPLYIVVETPAEEAAAIADGWYLARAEALRARPDAAAPLPGRKR